MRARAIRDLAQLSDEDFFEQVAEGLGHVHDNATRIEEDARLLYEQKHHRGSHVLLTVAAEEAAKFLILLDAVRCPRQPAAVFSRQLGRFNDHLAKGIYAEYYKLHPATFEEVEHLIARERADFYLDGPNDVDWIFRNRIIDQRESALYVDYMETDDGRLWVAPHDVVLEMGLGYHAPAVITLARQLYAIGFANGKALAVIAEIWRPVVMTPEFRWWDLRTLNHRTLQALDEKGLLVEAADRTYADVVDRWLFPLHSIDLSPIKVEKEKLRAIQQNWGYDQMGV